MATKAAKPDSYDELRTKLDKLLGVGAGRPVTETAMPPVPRVSTGSLLVDHATGGGLPMGRISEIYGAEGAGKTTLALSTLKNIQATIGDVAVIDAEFNHDPEWARAIGLNLSRNWVCQPEYGEQALEALEYYLEAGIKGILVDSVAALVPKAEYDGDVGESHVGRQARMMSQELKRVVGKIHRAGACVIFLNQLREKIGVIYGSPETRPGGKALKFYASTVLDVRRKEGIEDSTKEVVANLLKVTVKKNRGGPQYRVAHPVLTFGIGLDPIAEIIDELPAIGLVTKSGNHYQLGDQKVNGKQKLVQLLREQPELFNSWLPVIRHFLDTGEVLAG
jgi:recombination protein RecA